MVAIFGGAGAGVERGSANILGPMGQMGDAAVGRGGESVAVNARSGNLVISRQDEFLAGLGPDAAISRTYNSLLDAGWTDRDNGDGWQQSPTRQVFGLQGTINAAGSSIKRLGADGTVSIYTYETRGAETAYWNADGSGAHDKIVRSGVQWIWTDGDSQSTEKYVASPVTSGVSRLFQVADISNNIMTFHYVSGSDKIASVETKNGESIEYTWSNNNITQITTRYIDIHDEDGDGNTTETFSISRASYGYDSSNRLISVTTDLTPENSSDSDIYTTTYTYSGSSKRVATISQTDGSHVSITYFDGGKVKFIDLTSSAGMTRQTSFAYGDNHTSVVHADGSRNNHYFDSEDRLTQINYQAEVGGPITTELFAYDSDGNVLSVTNRAGEVVTYEYDVFGTTTKITDANLNVTDRFFDSNNRLIREEWRGSEAGVANVVRYSHYVYESVGRLRYVISPDGQVTEHRYTSGAGVLRYTIHYAEHPYSVTASTPSISAMHAWRDGLLDRSSSQFTRYDHDARGNLTQVLAFSAATPSGGATSTEGKSQTHYVYDQAGQLLSSQINGDSAETFVYDGLGRLVSSVDGANNTISIVFDHAASKTIITNAAGYISTETYNLAGELISRSDNTTAAGSTTTGSETATYQYDNMGRLRVMTDQRGRRTFYLYDQIGNQTGVVTENGDVREYQYDDAGRVVASASYINDAHQHETALTNPNNTLTVADIRPVSHSKDTWNWTVYDSGDRVVQTIDSVGAVTNFEYDKANNLVRTTSYANQVSVASLKTTAPSSPVAVTLDAANDIVTRSFYNLSGRQIGSLDGEGYLTEMVYDSANQLVRQTTYSGQTTPADRANGTFAQLKASAGASGRSVASVYDGQGQLRYQVDDLGYVVKFEYDQGQRVTQTRAYYSPISTSDYTYDAVQAAATNHANDRVTSTVYDSAGRVASVTDPTGLLTTYIYDVHNNIASVAQNDGGTNRTSYSYYASSGRLLYTVDAEGYVVGFEYNDSGQVLRERVYDAPIGVTPGTTLAQVASAMSPADSSQAFADTTYSYNNQGRHFRTINAEGEQVRDFFHHNGTISQTIRSHNLDHDARTYFDVDATGRTWRIRNAHGETGVGSQTNSVDGEQFYTQFVFDAFGRTTRVTDGEGQNTDTVFDRRGQATQVTDAAGGVTTFEYNAFGEVVKVTDPRGNSTYTYYDDLGRVTHVVEAAQFNAASNETEYYVTQTSYTAFGEVESVTRYHNVVIAPTTAAPPTVAMNAGQDAVTTFAYDLGGRLVSTIDAEQFVESYAYNGFGERIATTAKSNTSTKVETGADANITKYIYDARGLMVAEVMPMAAFDKGGNVLSATIGNVYRYDARGNRIETIEAVELTGNETADTIESLFTNASALQQVDLPETRRTTYNFDKVNRLISTVGQARTHYSQADHSLVGDWANQPPSETITYDTRGNVISTQDASGAKTFFYYDDLDRKVVEIDALGTYTAYEYDANSNVTRIRIFEDQVDPASLSHEGGSQEQAAAAPIGNARETVFFYDALNRLTKSSVVLPSGYQVGDFNRSQTNPSWSSSTPATLDTEYEYDANGNVVKTIDPNGNATYAYYDKLGRKIGQVDALGAYTKWEYDSEGNVLTETQFGVEVSNPALGTPPADPANTDARISHYTYDEVGNRLTETRLNIAVHDSASPGTTNILSGTVTYTYNGLGQVTRKTEATGDFINYTYDDGGRLTNERRKAYAGHTGVNVAPETDYFYDGLGNLTRSLAIGKAGASSRATRYEYNEGGLLSKVTDPEDNIRLFFYDISGRQIIERYTRTESDGTTRDEAQLTSHDQLGRVTEQKVARRENNAWVFDTDGDGVSTTSDAITSHIEYNAYGDVIRTSTNGRWETENKYDLAGRMWASNAGDGIWKYFGYDANGNQTIAVTSAGENLSSIGANADFAISDFAGQRAITQLDVNATFTEYDARNMATQVVEEDRELAANSAQHLTTTRTYNAFGEVEPETDARGATLSYTYNTMGRLIRSESPTVSVTNEDGSTQWVKPAEDLYYDQSGRLVAQRDANGAYSGSGSAGNGVTKTANTGNLTRFELLTGTGYSGTEALITRQINADGGIMRTSFDAHGDARKIEVLVSGDGEPGGQADTWRTTNQEFDKLGRLTKLTQPNGLEINYIYDELGQRIGEWNSVQGSNNKQTTDYNKHGQVIATRAYGGDFTTISYDFDWFLEASGSGMTDVGGWVKATTFANNRTLTETSDIFGRAISKNDLGGHVTTYSYDKAGRQITSAMGGSRRYGEDRTPASRRHHRRGGAHAVVNAFEIDIERQSPAVRVRACQMRDRLDHAGVVDQHVQPAKGAHCRVDGGLHLPKPADVTRYGQRGRSDLTGKFGDAVFAAGA